MRNKAVLLSVLLNALLIPCNAQSFEGVITINISTPEEKKAVLYIKGRKMALENEVDSVNSITLIQNRETGAMVVLKKQHDLKYGFRTMHHVEDEEKPRLAEVVDGVELKVTAQKQVMNGYQCTRIEAHAGDTHSEAWVTKDPGFTLTDYFPGFLDGNMDYDAFKSRYAVDQEGLILYYSEMNLNSGIEHKFEIDVEKKELSSGIFLPASDYAVFDEEGFRNLYLEGQKDELKHKQWSEFMQLFGSK